jgi:hypothetical protein
LLIILYTQRTYVYVRLKKYILAHTRAIHIYIQYLGAIVCQDQNNNIQEYRTTEGLTNNNLSNYIQMQRIRLIMTMFFIV